MAKLNEAAVARVLSDYRNELWKVRGILRCVLRSAESAERSDGVDWSDVQYAIEAAVTTLEPVCEDLEPAVIASRACDLADEVPHAA